MLCVYSCMVCNVVLVQELSMTKDPDEKELNKSCICRQSAGNWELGDVITPPPPSPSFSLAASYRRKRIRPAR